MNYIQYMKEPFQPIGFTVGVPTDQQASAGVLKIRLAGITSDKTPTREELILQREELARSLAKKENNIITATDKQNAEIDANIENAVTPRWLKVLKLAKNAANFGLGAGAFVGTTMAYPYFAAAGPGGLAAAGGLQGTALGMMGNALENLYGFNVGLTTGSAIKDAMLGATGEVVLGPMIGKVISWVGNKTAPVWNAARHYASGLYNTTNYSSLGNRLAHPIESLRFAKINTKLSDLVRRAYPEETAKLMLEEASPLFKTVRYYNKGNSGPLYIGGTEVPLLIEGLRNTPTTTVKMWDRAHEYGHLFDDALRRLDAGMARGSFGLSKEGISLVPKNYTYSPGVGINTPRGQMEFMADNIASSLYPEPKHVGMLHGEVAPYLERLALAAQVPFGSMYVENGRAHVPYFLPEYKNFGRFIPTSTQRGSLGKGYKLNAQDGHSILLDTEIKPQTIPTKTSLAFFERHPSKISKGERLGTPKGLERTIINNEEEILNNAKSFAEKYGYESPETIDAAKAMYKQHNSWFRTVLVDPLYDNSKYGLAFTDPKLQTLPKTESAKILASKGYPAAYRCPGDYEPGVYLDDFVFASPSMATNAGYLGNPGTYTVMLQRPFSFRNPLDWHNVADYRPISKYIYEPLLVGLTLVGNVGPKYELKLATKHLIPVKIAQPTDKGTLLGEYLGNIEYKSGGSIHIKKKNKGKFTASAKAAGEGVQEHAHKVMNDPNATPLQKKRANFAIQAKKWHSKHQNGGIINYLNYFNYGG